MLSAIILYGIASTGAALAAPALQTRQNNGWPAFDVVPSTDSEWARYWVSLYDFSAVPGIPATVERTCNAATDPFNVERAGENCYWTCNQCIRDADVSICPNRGDWGLTFDDGPTPETAELLDNLAIDGTKATFFVIGSQALRHPALVRRIFDEGHQLAVHTWSHEPLTSLTNEQIVVELEWTRQIIIAIVGRDNLDFMRPPYGDIDDRVRAISQQMGLVPAMWTPGFDTNDWKLVETPEARVALDGEFEGLLGAGRARDTGFISLQHDSGAPTVRYAIDVILPRARREGWNLVSLAQCGAV